MLFPRLVAAIVGLTPLAVSAHEYWIEPLAYQVENDGQLQAHFKNGQEFAGTTLAYFKRNTKRFEVVVDGEARAVAPRDGDSPALDIAAPMRDGLITVVYETAPSLITYREWPKFEKFVHHKAFDTALSDHVAAGWSQVKFRERYTRHAKTLMAVGDGEGADISVGLQTEFVALTNPYASTFDNMMKVSLLYEGTPRADAQIEVFDRAPDNSVTISLHKTGADGTATIPVLPAHTYLFDAVVLRAAPEASTEENAIVWETLWAALTFKVPDE